MRRESGFSLIELLTVMTLTAVLVTLGAFAIRHFWFVRSLEGGADEVVTQLRRLQQRVGAASNPLVYGARFTDGSSSWQLVEYHIIDDTCELISETGFDRNLEFDASVRVRSAVFAEYPAATDQCLGLTPEADDVVFFFARGSATRGNIVIEQPILDRTAQICVGDITGRVEETTGSCP